MKRLISASVLALASLVLAVQAHADPAAYGIESVGASLSIKQAGAHPDFMSNIVLKTENGNLPAFTRDVTIELPRGLVANPNAVPKCTGAQFVSTDFESKANATGCPQDSQVGVTHIVVSNPSGSADFVEPVFNLEPRPGEPARLGFIALTYPILIETELRPDYGVTATVRSPSSQAQLTKTETVLWGVPADESHDAERLTPYEATHNFGAIETPTGTRQSGLSPVPFMLNPTRCGEQFPLRAVAASYQEPLRQSEGSALLPAATGCSLLDFDPDLAIHPGSEAANTGTGLSVDLKFPQNGLEHPNLLGEDEQKRVEVTLPEGMTVNPSQAQGLGACTEADFARESAGSETGQGCPLSSKIGTVSAKTPLLEEEATGSLYVATPHANPFGSLIALYMVLKVPERGVVVKLPGRVAADPKTGQLTTTFGESPFGIPQLPVSEFHLHFRDGPRAPLVMPPSCGSKEATATFTSWGGHSVTTHPKFSVSGSCPNGNAAFAPTFEAGAISNSAATFSPFFLRFSRGDSDQELTRFSATLPPGEVAKLAGVKRCPAAAIEAARAQTGAEELASPSCPATSQIGHILAGAGVGPSLTYVPGSLYLAGPYQGSPLSVVAIVPAVAGPFDLGTVVTQEALGLDPVTGRAVVDGSSAEPLPHILQGIPLHLRDVRVFVDRPDFALNPTSCDPLATDALLGGSGADPFSPFDDVLARVSARYQAANCSRLHFAPRLSLRLRGGTSRRAYPALKAVLKPRRGDANIAFAQVALPHSEFLAQEHINTICTRVQFAVGACPKGAVYGHARAFSPLLDQPLEGSVYLRSSNHLLPDLVADLHGEVDIVLVGRIDTYHRGIRTTFPDVPDAPVSKFELSMRGGKKGLLVNSTNLCAVRSRALVTFKGHNGRQAGLHPRLADTCTRKARRRK
jgi:hypothetical protein